MGPCSRDESPWSPACPARPASATPWPSGCGSWARRSSPPAGRPHDAEMPWGATHLPEIDRRDLEHPSAPADLVDEVVERHGALDIVLAVHARSSSSRPGPVDRRGAGQVLGRERAQHRAPGPALRRGPRPRPPRRSDGLVHQRPAPGPDARRGPLRRHQGCPPPDDGEPGRAPARAAASSPPASTPARSTPAGPPPSSTPRSTGTPPTTSPTSSSTSSATTVPAVAAR